MPSLTTDIKGKRGKEMKSSNRKKCLSALLLTLFSAFCLLSCEGQPLSPGERLSRIEGSEIALPAFRMYDSEATLSDEHYMPEGMASALYDLMGYSELSHAESFAFLLSARGDAFLECVLFLSADRASASELAFAASARGDFLQKNRYIGEDLVHIYRTGRYVFAVYGLDRRTADALERLCLR